MKVSVKSEYHQGIQPIRVLQHNIIAKYENTNSEFLKTSRDLVNNNGLQPGISYFIYEKPIVFSCEHFKRQTPFVDGNKKIAIHETFLSYVWIMSYCLWVLYYEAVAKPMQNQQSNKEVNKINTILIKQTEELFQYGKSLITTYSSWDKKNLPNPEEYSSDEEFYILRANGIFVHALNFILCHEFAHVEKKHIDEIKKRAVGSDERKIFEKEADARAIELMLEGKDGIQDKTIELGILIGLTSILYFKSNTDGGLHHPDTDDRIKTYLDKINPNFEEPIWGVASLAIKLWDNQFNLNFNWSKEANDFKELFQNTLTQIENRK